MTDEQIAAMTIEERLDLIDRIEDILPIDHLPEWQIKLLEARLAEAEANPGIGRPWREVLDRGAAMARRGAGRHDGAPVLHE